MKIQENGVAAENADNVSLLHRETDAAVYEIGPGDYQKLAEGTSHVRYSWSGNMNYARWYLKDPYDEDQMATLGYYYPPEGGWEVANDTIVINSQAQNPVLAHTFINFLLDIDVGLTNFGYEGFQPPFAGGGVGGGEPLDLHLASTLSRAIRRGPAATV